ncbi:MAG: FliH/SctL family protein [Granulosicoccus sp.]
MFRVLSDEESKKVTRWQAPELGSGTAVVANTRQRANPQQHDSNANVRSLLGSLDLKPGHSQTPSSAPRLQPISPVDVFANRTMMQAGGAEGGIAPVSAELLQTSYDEGYSRGFAEGNSALHQHSIKELRTVIAALTEVSERAEDTDLENELVALSMDIARVVIRREISMAPEILHEIVIAGLEQIEGGSAAQRAYLHPLDANIVREHLSADSVLRVLDDPSLERGACRIESGSSVVNAGIENWLEIVSAQLGLVPDAADAPVVDSLSTSKGSSDSTLESELPIE